MKKIALVLAIVMLLTFTATGCGKVRGVEIDYGTSEMYTEDDMKDALPSIFENFVFSYNEGTLFTLTYAGDDVSQEKLEFWNTRKYYKRYDKCMIFYSTAETDKWNDKTNEYELRKNNITWILGKKDDEPWGLVNYKNNYFD